MLVGNRDIVRLSPVSEKLTFHKTDKSSRKWREWWINSTSVFPIDSILVLETLFLKCKLYSIYNALLANMIWYM